MDGGKKVPLDEMRLTFASRAFLKPFISWAPDWKKYCSMDEAPWGCDLQIEIPSPTGDPRLSIHVWYASTETDISLAFGNWHVHGDVSIEVSENKYLTYTILDGIKMIVAGDLVNFSRAPSYEKLVDILYLPSQFQIENELTSPFSKGRIRIMSWDGTKDKEISLESIIKS